ncbi:hypothetical protein GE09DRAFT_1226875 [Coniochaeta sp. 2T2.1]|nr:hypothetical protein GE09DRAFT_1226875 [Coniochaeta sp. 2T2.1]
MVPPTPSTNWAKRKKTSRSTSSQVMQPPTVAETQQYDESCDEFAVDEEPAPLQYIYADDEEPSQDSTSAGAEPAATSFTSSFNAQS